MPLDESWRNSLVAVNALNEAMTDLQRTPTGMALFARETLRSDKSWHGTLMLLELADTRCTEALIDDLVRISVSDRLNTRISNLLGRLSHRKAEQLIPPVVWALLDNPGADYYDYRRLAELLDHLGLADALAELCARAAASDDPDMREVAEDFGPED